MFGGDLRANRGDDLRVREVSGDARIEDFTGAPLLGGVRGDLIVRNVQGLEVREGVSGDAHIENCRSVILDGAIGGDLHIERCAGGVFTDAVGGDAKLVDVQEAGIGVVGGDLEIHTSTAHWRSMSSAAIARCGAYRAGFVSMW